MNMHFCREFRFFTIIPICALSFSYDAHRQQRRSHNIFELNNTILNNFDRMIVDFENSDEVWSFCRANLKQHSAFGTRCSFFISSLFESRTRKHVILLAKRINFGILHIRYWARLKKNIAQIHKHCSLTIVRPK